VDGASSQGLFLGFLARDFGTTMTSVPRLFPQFHGSEASGQMYFTEGGSYGTRLQLCWPVDSAVVAASTRTAQAVVHRDQRKLRQRGEYRLCKCPSPGKAGGLAGSTPARAYPHFCATRHDAWLLT
jgi:hypothetical protein